MAPSDLVTSLCSIVAPSLLLIPSLFFSSFLNDKVPEPYMVSLLLLLLRGLSFFLLLFLKKKKKKKTACRMKSSTSLRPSDSVSLTLTTGMTKSRPHQDCNDEKFPFLDLIEPSKGSTENTKSLLLFFRQFPRYFVSVGLSQVLQINVCSVDLLRAVNLGFGFLNTWVMFLLVERLHPQSALPLWQRVLNVASLGTFPLLFFFQFLYYTDQGSTFFVLLAYLMFLHRQYLVCSLVRIPFLFLSFCSLHFSPDPIQPSDWLGFFDFSPNQCHLAVLHSGPRPEKRADASH